MRNYKQALNKLEELSRLAQAVTLIDVSQGCASSGKAP